MSVNFIFPFFSACFWTEDRSHLVVGLMDFYEKTKDRLKF